MPSPLSPLIDALMADPATARHLTPTTLAVLVDVAAEEGRSVGDVAENIGRSRPAVSRAVDILLERGMVCVEHATDDRRRVHLTLAPAGRDFYARLCAAVGVPSSPED